MRNRFFRLTATAGATALLAVSGTVAAASASAATAPTTVVTHTATVPASVPIANHHWWPWCDIELLGICINL